MSIGWIYAMCPFLNQMQEVEMELLLLTLRIPTGAVYISYTEQGT